MEFDDFDEALSALIASDAANYGDCQSIEELNRLHLRLNAFVAEVTAAFEVGEQRAADRI